MALTNLDREALGLAPMDVDPYLASLARNGSWACPGKSTAMAGRAQDMLDRGYFAHTPAGCGTNILPVLMGAGFGSVAENIGWNNWSTDPSGTYDIGCDATGANCSGVVDSVPQNVAVLQRAWMNSATHRANILGNYDRIGCGLATAATWQGYTNVVMAVCLFANGGTRLTDDDAPAFTSPAGGAVATGDTIHAAVSVSDASGLSTAALLVDGNPYFAWTFNAPLTSGRLSIDVPTTNLRDGAHVLAWQATDLAGQIGKLPVSVSVGKADAPVLDVAFTSATTEAPVAVSDGAARIVWTETAPAGLEIARVLTQYRAPMGADGSCTGVTWTAVQTLNPATNSAAFAHVLPNTCYRWHVEVSAMGVAAAADSAAMVDGRPTAKFTTPRANLIINSSTAVTAAWTESNPAHQAYTRSVEVWSGAVTKAGSCSAIDWTLASTLTPAGTSVKLNLAKRTCYRLVVNLATATGTSSADSGWFLVGIPVVTFTNPIAGTIAKATSSSFKVRWSVANPTSKAITGQTLKVYWTKKTTAGCGASWKLLSSRAVSGSVASISTASGRCYRVTVVARNGWGFASSAAVSGLIRR